MFLAPSKSGLRDKIWNMSEPNTSDHIQINIRMQNWSQEPPASSKAPNQVLKEMDVLYTFKIRIESQYSDHRCIKDQWPYQNQDQDAKTQSGTSSILQSCKFVLNGQGSSLQLQYLDRAKIPNIGVSKTRDNNQIKIKIPDLGISSIFQSSVPGLKWYGCSLYLQNQDIRPKFGPHVWQRTLTISISRSRC